MFFNAIDDPKAAHWRAATLDFSDDAAMFVEMPNKFDTENFRKETPIGPMKHAADRAKQGNCFYWATVDVPVHSSPEALKDETIETLVTAAAAKNGRTIVATKWIEHRGHTGIEYRTTKTDPDGKKWQGRAQMFRVGDRFLEVGLIGVGPDVADDAQAKRFFRSLRIPVVTALR